MATLKSYFPQHVGRIEQHLYRIIHTLENKNRSLARRKFIAQQAITDISLAMQYMLFQTHSTGNSIFNHQYGPATAYMLDIDDSLRHEDPLDQAEIDHLVGQCKAFLEVLKVMPSST